MGHRDAGTGLHRVDKERLHPGFFCRASTFSLLHYFPSLQSSQRGPCRNSPPPPPSSSSTQFRVDSISCFCSWSLATLLPLHPARFMSAHPVGVWSRQRRKTDKGRSGGSRVHRAEGSAVWCKRCMGPVDGPSPVSHTNADCAYQGRKVESVTYLWFLMRTCRPNAHVDFARWASTYY